MQVALCPHECLAVQALTFPYLPLQLLRWKVQPCLSSWLVDGSLSTVVTLVC